MNTGDTIRVGDKTLTFEDIDRIARWALKKKAGHSRHLLQWFREDLLQEARLCVFIAAKRFNPERNTSFLTFACSYIRWATDTVQRNYQKNREVSVDVNAEYDEDSDVGSAAQTAMSVPPPEFFGPDDRQLHLISKALQKTKGVPLDRLKRIVAYRMEGMTFDDIGAEMGVSRQRVHNQYLAFESTLKQLAMKGVGV